jgi:peptidoglycan/LPS O-acetylase OafA/YrhL
VVLGSAAVTSIPRRWFGWTLTLGAASYSIYLVHNPLVSLFVRVLRSVAPDMSPLAALIMLALLVLTCAIGNWYVYERQALRVVRGWLAGARLFRPGIASGNRGDSG